MNYTYVQWNQLDQGSYDVPHTVSVQQISRNSHNKAFVELQNVEFLMTRTETHSSGHISVCSEKKHNPFSNTELPTNFELFKSAFNSIHIFS